MVVSKKACITWSFYLAYLTFLLFGMFGHIPTLGGYLKATTNIGLALFVVIICLRIRDYTAKEAMILAAGLVYGLLLAVRTNDYVIFKLSMMIFAAKGMDFRKCIKFDLYARVFFSAVLIFLFYCGIAPDVTSVYNGSLRHSMGFQNPNHIGLEVFIIVMELFYVEKMHLNIPKYIMVFGLLIFEYRTGGSRTAELFILIAIVLVMVYSYWPDFYEKRIVNFFMQWAAVICAIMTGIAFGLYRAGNTGAILLDKVLSYRITNISFYYDNFGVSLFGCDTSAIKRTVDSFYGFSFIVLGIVTFIILIYLYRKLEKRLCNMNKPLAIIIFCFFLYGVSERLWMYVDYNMFMLAFAELVYPYFTVGRLNLKM